ncbi:DUF975 family protein [Periweissella cryptocerci]|nr:DUF975 family protein [Periweissella cryptocerci]
MQQTKISSYRKDARRLLKGRWGQAVRLNLFPSILALLGTLLTMLIIVAAVALTAYLLQKHGADVTKWASDNKSLFDGDGADNVPGTFGMNFGNQVSSYLMQIVMAMIATGISWTFLDWFRNPDKQVRFGNAFDGFQNGRILANFMINLISVLFQLLWAMLIIPLFIKPFSYAQSLLIYKDVTDGRPADAAPEKWTWYITESRKLMDGHKWRLFLLNLSFVGWYILAALSFGIGWLWILPYRNATMVAFYQDIAGDKYRQVPVNADIHD